MLIDLVARRTRADRARIGPRSRFIDFGLSSVAALELVVDLEQALGVSIPDADLAQLETLGDLAGYLERRLASGGHGSGGA